MRNKEQVNLEQLTKNQLYLRLGPIHARRYIAKNARSVFKKIIAQTCCYVCDYSLHIQVCHLKPVADFSKSARIYEINSPGNLVALCPNHHWELDHGLLELEYPIYYGVINDTI